MVTPFAADKRGATNISAVTLVRQVLPNYTCSSQHSAFLPKPSHLNLTIARSRPKSLNFLLTPSRIHKPLSFHEKSISLHSQTIVLSSPNSTHTNNKYPLISGTLHAFSIPATICTISLQVQTARLHAHRGLHTGVFKAQHAPSSHGTTAAPVFQINLPTPL
jgi:hypothetical protein